MINANSRSLASAAFGFVVAASLLTGCSSSFLNADDELRRENLELKDQVAKLQRTVDLRVAEIDTLHHATTQPTHIDGAEILRAVKLEFDRYSGPRDTKHDGVDDQMVLYMMTIDQHDRFIPVSGQATVQFVDIEAGKPPRLLLERVIGASELSLSYRENFTGTHYSFEIPLTDKVPASLTQVTVKVTLVDAATGATLTAEQVFPLKLVATK